MSDGLPLIKNVLTPSTKSILAPLGLKAAGSATDTAIQKKIFWIGDNCTDNFNGRNGRYHENN